jgi:hypothetical protein
MFNFAKWFSKNDEADQHKSNAEAAMAAHAANTKDRWLGVHRVVDTNLERVARREIDRSYKARSEALEN